MVKMFLLKKAAVRVKTVYIGGLEYFVDACSPHKESNGKLAANIVKGVCRNKERALQFCAEYFAKSRKIRCKDMLEC